MKAFFTQRDRDFSTTHTGALCHQMQRRLASARGNNALLQQLRQEANQLVGEFGQTAAVTRRSQTDRLDRTLAMLRH